MFPLVPYGKARRQAYADFFTVARRPSIIPAVYGRLLQMSYLDRALGDRLRFSGATLRRVCTFVLVLALAATLAEWALELASRRAPAESVRAVSTGDSAARTQAADIAPIAVLFGARPGSDGSDIRLAGVIALGKEGRGIALLAVDGQPAFAFRAGEEIATGVTLAEVRADRVVVSRSGATHELVLPAKAAPEGITKVP